MSGQDGEVNSTCRPVPTSADAGSADALAQLAHDVRNRLTVITGCLELLSMGERGELTSAQRSLVAPALSSAHELAGIGLRLRALAGANGARVVAPAAGSMGATGTAVLRLS